MKEKGKEPEMPPLSLMFFVEYFWEVGPTMSTAMGPGPLSFQELESWMRLTGVNLEPWAIKMLRRLSFDYIEQAENAKKIDCPAPFGSNFQVKSLDEKLDDFLD